MRARMFVAALAVIAPAMAHAQSAVDTPAPPVPAVDDGEAARTLDLGAFVGVHAFGDDIELGNSWAAEQVPGTAVVVGGRAGMTLAPDLARGSTLDPQLGVEVELALALASTGSSMEGGRDSYFAPVFGWRGHGIARLRTTGRVHPHLVAGVSGETLVSDSPFATDDTDAAFYWGPGLTWRASSRFVARADLRHALTAGREDGTVNTFELHLGIEKSFELGGRRGEAAPRAPRDTDGDGIADARDACVYELETQNGFEDDDGCPDTPDRDRDGFPDGVDVCPTEAEVVNQIDDQDGCPEKDDDLDGILGSRDACPIDPEDVDTFQDDDGCPDLDDDGDLVPDTIDQCRLEPETMNGFHDGDGCPDEVPPAVKQYTGVIEGITFEYSRAGITRPGRKILNKAATVLREHPDIRVRIEGHTDPKGVREKNLSLSLRRAESVKWYLVDQGIAEDRIETLGLGPDRPRADNATAAGRAKNRRIEFHLIVGGATPAAPPPPEPAPATQPSPTQPSP